MSDNDIDNNEPDNEQLETRIIELFVTENDDRKIFNIPTNRFIKITSKNGRKMVEHVNNGNPWPVKNGYTKPELWLMNKKKLAKILIERGVKKTETNTYANDLIDMVYNGWMSKPYSIYDSSTGIAYHTWNLSCYEFHNKRRCMLWDIVNGKWEKCVEKLQEKHGCKRKKAQKM